NLRIGYGIIQWGANYNSLAAQLSNCADIEVPISSIVRNAFTQVNFSISTKDAKVYVKICVCFIIILF
ncbi:unnamed protein product, partial [Hymenolepis diminuta]